METPMPPYPAASWTRLGELLVQRRIEIDPRYRNRTVFADERGLHWRLLYDLERARRVTFGPETLAAVEVAYELAPGSIGRTLAGGPLETGRGNGHPAPAPKDSFAALEEIHPADRPAVRERLAEVRAMIRTARLYHPEGPLAGAWVFGDGTPEQRFWDAMAAQGSDEAELATLVAFGWAWDAATKAQSPRNPGLSRAVP